MTQVNIFLRALWAIRLTHRAPRKVVKIKKRQVLKQTTSCRRQGVKLLNHSLAGFRTQITPKKVVGRTIFLCGTANFRLGMLVFKWKLSRWRFWICNNYIDSYEPGYSRNLHTKGKLYMYVCRCYNQYCRCSKPKTYCTGNAVKLPYFCNACIYYIR